MLVKDMVFRNCILIRYQTGLRVLHTQAFRLFKEELLMLRGMVFVDHMNFDIALQNYYKTLHLSTPKLDYNKLLKKITAQIDNWGHLIIQLYWIKIFLILV